MLAELEQVPGVSEARVDWTGTIFLVRGRDAQEKALRVLEAAGYEAAIVPAEGHIASLRAGDRWLRAAETIRLSTVEAETLSDRWAKQVGERAGLAADETARLRDVIREEFLSRLRGYHDAGGMPRGDTDRARADILKLLDRIAARAAEFLPAEKAKNADEELRRAVLRTP